jgi:hypothetical protein
MQKKVKVKYNGKRVEYIYLHLTWWGRLKLKIKRFLKRVLFIGFILLTAWGLLKIGGYINPTTIITKAEIIKEVPRKAPILEKIAKCESGGRHYASNGQVLVRANESKTHNSVDIGKYQINSLYWGSKATELGLNLWIEEDNENMAIWIYENKGTEPWKASKLCWNK